MLPNINNYSNENAASSFFSSSLRSYQPNSIKSGGQNPFTKKWLDDVINDVRNVREAEQMGVLQSQLLEIEKKCEIYSYQKKNMDVIKNILDDTLKRKLKYHLPKDVHENYNHFCTSNEIGSYRDLNDLVANEGNVVDPFSYELLHGRDKRIRHFNPSFDPKPTPIKRNVRKIIVVNKPKASKKKKSNNDFGENGDDLMMMDDSGNDGETLDVFDEEEEEDLDEEAIKLKLEGKKQLEELYYAKEWIYEKKWYTMTMGVYMLNDDKNIQKALRIRRVKRYEKILKNNFFFGWSKRVVKMKLFIEKERKNWARSDDKKKRKKRGSLNNSKATEQKDKDNKKKSNKRKTKLKDKVKDVIKQRKASKKLETANNVSTQQNTKGDAMENNRVDDNNVKNKKSNNVIHEKQKKQKQQKKDSAQTDIENTEAKSKSKKKGGNIKEDYPNESNISAQEEVGLEEDDNEKTHNGKSKKKKKKKKKKEKEKVKSHSKNDDGTKKKKSKKRKL